MSDKQITGTTDVVSENTPSISVEQLVDSVSNRLCDGHISFPNIVHFENLFAKFAAQQRADATRELKREIADARKWMREALSKCAAYGSELAAAKQDARNMAALNALLLEQADAAKQQYLDLEKKYNALPMEIEKAYNETCESMGDMYRELETEYQATCEAHNKTLDELEAAKQQLAEAEKRASAAARFIDDETPKQHECDMLTDRGPCKRCDFQLAAHAARTAQAEETQHASQ